MTCFNRFFRTIDGVLSSTKMKNDGQPIRDYVPSNSRWTKDPRWFLALKLGGTFTNTLYEFSHLMMQRA